MNSCPESGETSPNLGRRAVDALLAQFGKWPLKAAAAEIGVPVDTWKCWKEGRSKPSTDHLSRLFSRLGAGFRAAVLSPWETAGPNVAAFQRAQPKEASRAEERTRRRA